MKRKAFALLLAFLLGTFNLAYALDIPNATPNFYVNDFAEIFSDEDFNTMMQKAIELDKNYNGIQVVVTTMKTLNGESLEVYANKMFNKYGIGKNDMGLLILMVTDDRLIRVETGAMMEAYFVDGEIAAIMQEKAIPYLKENRFPEGIVTLQDAYITAIKEKVDAEIEKTAVVMEAELNESAVTANEKQSSKTSILFSILPAVTVFLGMLGFNKKSKQRNKTKLEKSEQSKKEYVAQNEELSMQLENSKYRLQEYIERERVQDNEIERYSRELSKTCDENRKLNLQNSELQQEVDSYKKKLEHVHILYPNIDSEIEAWIAEEKRKADMQVAADFDAFARSKMSEVPSIDNEKFFKQILDNFQSITDTQRGYVTTDINSIKHKYAESVKLRKAHEEKLAFEAEKAKAECLRNEIEKELYGEIIPTWDYCTKLEKLISKYNYLGDNVKYIVTSELVNSLRTRTVTARELAEEEERKRKEEERRLREERERREAEERKIREEQERRRREEERKRKEEEERIERERRRKREEERRRQQRTSSLTSYSSSRSSYSSRSSSSNRTSSGRSSFGSFRGHGGSSRGGGASGSF